MKKVIVILFFTSVFIGCKDESKKSVDQAQIENTDSDYYNEPYRPQYHFSPEEKWMNDPNGMVYNNGIYHLFYQYYPDDIVWGPMHWGHAVSRDLVHWEHRPIALYPDELGYIFSGSAVVDKNNTSGFGSDENSPLVAIYTYHDIEGEKAGKSDYQTQGIALSLDNGETWTKYEGNPVIGNDGIKDIRDPKVMWHEPSERWIMSLAVGDHAQFFSSKDLKEWEKTGEFGKEQGAHGGVWECPDLFKLKVDGSDEEKWVMIISIGSGAPNGGSGTQYFIGDFDGKTFTTDQTENKWVDWGTDNYAGVAYSNAPNDEWIFIGWMSNWIYAKQTPTEKWRSAMTLPRKLSLRKSGNDFYLANYPVGSIEDIIKRDTQKEITVAGGANETINADYLNQSEIRFSTASQNFQLKFGNESQEETILTMFGEEKEFFLDRSNSGKTDFQEDFGGVQRMPVRNLPDGEYDVRIFIDRSSIEIFLDKGQYAMTAQLFPNEPYTSLTIENLGEEEILLDDFAINKVERIWKAVRQKIN